MGLKKFVNLYKFIVMHYFIPTILCRRVVSNIREQFLGIYLQQLLSCLSQGFLYQLISTSITLNLYNYWIKTKLQCTKMYDLMFLTG